MTHSTLNRTSHDDAYRIAVAHLMRTANLLTPAISDHARRSLSALIDIVGYVAAARDLRATVGLPSVGDDAAFDERVRADVHLGDQVGARLLTRDDPNWPQRLCEDPLIAPVALWVRGTALADLDHPVCTIAGSRAATAYGETVAADLGYHARLHGLNVAAGAALGIDSAALRGACAADPSGSATTHAAVPIAVLAGGVDFTYATTTRALLDAVVNQGMVVSEFPPDTTPVRSRFIRRGRMLAALGHVTVIVEGGRISGAQTIAETAAVWGRSVFAVPGPITSVHSHLPHTLIARGIARLLPNSDATALLAAATHPNDG